MWNGHLKPEQRTAMSVLLRYLPQSEELLMHRLDYTEMVTNKIAFFPTLITARALPSHEGWHWNQTKAKLEAQLPHDQGSVVFWKVVPRYTPATRSAPSLKTWIFHITFTDNPTRERLSAIWCERGHVISPQNDLDRVFALDRSSSPASHPTSSPDQSPPAVESEESCRRTQSAPQLVLGESITIDDLSFLRTDVDPRVARELWGDDHPS